MDIKSRFARARDFIVQNKDNLVICAEFVLVAAIFFGLGILYDESMLKNIGQIRVIAPETASQILTSPNADNASKPKEKAQTKSIGNALAQAGNFVASKNGTAYYSLTCKNNIKEENKIYFQTEDDAGKAGFSPAKNCFK